MNNNTLKISAMASRFALTTIALLTFLLQSCKEADEKEEAACFVINELMPANHASLQASDGARYDWIEIKNISNAKASLEGYSLAYKKAVSKKKDKAPKWNQWNFPDIELEPGQCVVVFASKKDLQDNPKELHTNFRLSADGGTVRLIKAEGVVDEVDYEPMEDDMCHQRTDSGTFEDTYTTTPGFENTREGYERYCSLIEQQRADMPLKLWEVHMKAFEHGTAWVEVKNVSDKPIDLQHYSLVSSKKNAERLPLPSVQIAPRELYVVDCKKAKFKIGSTKSLLLLRDDQFADGLAAAAAPYGIAMGRTVGKDGFFYLPTATRGTENTSKHYRHIAQEPTFSVRPNVYAGKDSINVALDAHGYTIRFTTDGTSPTASSPVYKNSLFLTRTTTIRAFCEGDSMVMRSPITTATYILGETHTLPVVNITIAHADLYDYRRGIYVAGPGANSEYPHYEANYWKSWWKSANVEFFDSIGGGFSAPCELAIFGGFSRTLDKKSFKIRFKDQRGLANLDYDLFNTGTVEELKNFVLRSGSQDYTGVMMRDEFFTSLMRPYCPTLLIQAYRPVALYINGEYFGLYFIREKIDRRFVAHHLGVSKDSISIIMSAIYAEEGTKQDYQALISYATSHDLSTPEAYQYVEKRFDLTGLIDYKLGQIYSCNTDLGNVRYVHSPDPSNDQRWRIIYYDLDATWTETKPVSAYLNANTQDHVTHQVNILIDRLLKNKAFRQLFLERLSLHLHKTFSTENATAVFDQLTSTIRPEMRRNCRRWPEMSYATWEKHVAAFRAKFNDRPRTMLSQLRQYLAITADEDKQYFSDLGY